MLKKQTPTGFTCLNPAQSHDNDRLTVHYPLLSSVTD